ncbi:SOS response-associated peptidase family protein [Aporhodopirellula aestuarii]|uniref:Abasic site processing protein n=1 Tax=Aporhodopirellula aestuarii TaxID=2950107 RepID=A0ABT0U6B0_9BACT|nr:SOS response-associated peptidase family protein [Aporhodopirellula aestuarii]MCM2372381.1 SOS response-associated peptidase [Aporhodopirellula aestuarii]
MCNRFHIRTNLHAICEHLQAQTTFEFDVPQEVFPMTKAPVAVLNREGMREIRPMTFGMGDAKGKSGGARYMLNNTRIESHTKWPWKTPFEKYRCVVPMTSFREPCYWGETAGTEVSFAAPNDEILLAAAIFSFRKDAPDDPELSMSLIMRPALPYVMEHGHHRSPFFLKKDGLDDWMDRKPRPPGRSLEVLRDYAYEPPLTHQVDREMAASWVKRKSANLKKRDEQLADIETTGPLGFELPS